MHSSPDNDPVNEVLFEAQDNLAFEAIANQRRVRKLRAQRTFEFSSLAKYLEILVHSEVTLTLSGGSLITGKLRESGPHIARLEDSDAATHYVAVPHVAKISLDHRGRTNDTPATSLSIQQVIQELLDTNRRVRLTDTLGVNQQPIQLLGVAEDYVFFLDHHERPTAQRLNTVVVVSL
ncbi:MAG: hypothetical protein ACYDHP_04935 [Ferrimicrobium sp.]